ncbi:hypothetical protein UlMin_032450 [Ulmus minor]
MSLAKSSKPNRHVAVFVFPFGSHPLPLVSLVQKLAREAPNVHFSFFNTAISNTSIFPPNLPTNIKAFDLEDGMPAGHVLSGKPHEAVNLFLKAAPEMFKKAIDVAETETGLKITCMLTDAFLTFSADIAEDLRVPWIPTWTPLPCSLSAHVNTDLIRHKDAKLDFIPGLSDMYVKDLPNEVISDGLEESLFSQALGRTGGALPRATAVVFKFYKELNPPQLNADFESKFKSIFHVGFLTLTLPLPPILPSSSDPTGCLSWLDTQKARSVAYVSFGTVAVPPNNELMALAEALEESKIPFLWSIKDQFQNRLPDGFLERTSSHAKIVPWTPQTQVLSHVSIGVFVTHCGSNSVYESLVNCVPMICRPFFGDQHMTGRMVESIWEIGLKAEGGVLTKSGLLKSFDLILGKEQGKKMRERAAELRDRVLEAAGPKGSAARDFKALVGLIST